MSCFCAQFRQLIPSFEHLSEFSKHAWCINNHDMWCDYYYGNRYVCSWLALSHKSSYVSAICIKKHERHCDIVLCVCICLYVHGFLPQAKLCLSYMHQEAWEVLWHCLVCASVYMFMACFLPQVKPCLGYTHQEAWEALWHFLSVNLFANSWLAFALQAKQCLRHMHQENERHCDIVLDDDHFCATIIACKCNMQSSLRWSWHER